MQRHLQSPGDKLEKLLAFGLLDGDFHFVLAFPL